MLKKVSNAEAADQEMGYVVLKLPADKKLNLDDVKYFLEKYVSIESTLASNIRIETEILLCSIPHIATGP